MSAWITGATQWLRYYHADWRPRGPRGFGTALRGEHVARHEGTRLRYRGRVVDAPGPRADVDAQLLAVDRELDGGVMTQTQADAVLTWVAGLPRPEVGGGRSPRQGLVDRLSAMLDVDWWSASALVHAADTRRGGR